MFLLLPCSAECSGHLSRLSYTLTLQNAVVHLLKPSQLKLKDQGASSFSNVHVYGE
jgi:hypothetical protein